ncbi:MAG: flavodoxin family protein [Armatimonadota bacterium]|nr:flavodoxin family protein [Armatimonadota bacterium]
MKKLVCVLGSPRAGGNSETIAIRLVDKAKQLGATTECFRLHDMTLKGCSGCMGCKTQSDSCVVQDDMKSVLDAVAGADAVVLTSPIYFGQISGQLKCFVDRTFSYLVPDFFKTSNPSRLQPGKKLALILTQGDPNESAHNIAPEYEEIFKFMGFETYSLRGLGLGAPTDAAGRAELLKEAEALAGKLLS